MCTEKKSCQGQTNESSFTNNTIRGRAPKAQGRGSNFFQQGGPDFSKQGGPGGVLSKNYLKFHRVIQINKK